MRRLLIAILLIIQLFLTVANAGEVNYSAQNLSKHTEYISVGTIPVKKISIDFKNYENALISLNNKSFGIFAQSRTNHFGGYFIGFLNSDFKDIIQDLILNNNKISIESNNIFSCLKNEVHTRAP